MKLLDKINVLPRMRLWQKFTVLGVLAVIAVAVPYVRYAQTAQEAINFTNVELSGLQPTQNMLNIIRLVQQHRGLSALVLSGNESQAQARTTKQAEVEQALALQDKLLAGVEAKGVQESWNSVKQGWRQVNVAGADARKSFAGHTELIAESLLLLESLGDHYQLTLDPTAHTYYLIQSALIHLPSLAEDYAQLRGLGSGRLAEAARLRASGADVSAAMSITDRTQIDFLSRAAKTTSESAYRQINKAMDAEPRIRTAIQAELAAPQEATLKLVQLAQKELVNAPAPTFDSTNYFRVYTEGIDAQFKLIARVQEVLAQELEMHTANLKQERLVTSVEILAAALLLALIAYLTVRNITGTVSNLQRSVDRVRQGDFDALQAIESKDEVGDIGRTVNGLLQDRIAAQKAAEIQQQKTEADKQKAEEENDRLNNSVISILQAVNQLSQRDLTTKAPVTQDVIGTVSDSINALTDETVKVLHGVSFIAGQVAQGSGKVKAQAELVSQTAADERESVQQMIGSLADATQSMGRVAVLADQSNKSAEQATQATGMALETVNNTVKGMESIRETIAETEKRIKRLGERSQEITGIVNLINTISERTHVLALNASMQAAVAGEAGRGFAVVAEEVQRLAESSRNATQQIGTLVSNIQLETNETINTVNRTIGQVVQGSEQAQKAGEQMRRTQEITAQLVAQVQRIAEGSEEQKRMTEQLLKSVQNIGSSTERTAQQIGAQNEETDALLLSSRQLVDSVNVFKLPRAA
jgi:twitching motility protein PilJ